MWDAKNRAEMLNSNNAADGSPVFEVADQSYHLGATLLPNSISPRGNSKTPLRLSELDPVYEIVKTEAAFSKVCRRIT